MASRPSLKYPRFVERPEQCMSCAYPLEGIPENASCPECGLYYRTGVSGIEFNGRANKAKGPFWRSWVWVLLALLWFGYANILPFLLTRDLAIAGFFFLALLAVSVGMFLSGPKQSNTVEFFIFTKEGLGRRSRSSASECGFVRWGSSSPKITVRRIGKIWSMIDIRYQNTDQSSSESLKIGFRIHDYELAKFRESLGMILDGTEILIDDTESFVK